MAHAAQTSRDFIGLPLVRKSSSLAVQMMPVPMDKTGYGLTMDMTYTPVSGPYSSLVEEATLAPTFTYEFPAPKDAEEYSGVLSVTNLPTNPGYDLFYGVTYELSDKLGNDAYLAPWLNLGGGFAQSQGRGMAAALVPTYDLFLPFVAKFYHGWTTVFSIQNLTGNFGNVAVTIYDQSGQVATSFLQQPLQPREIRRIDLDTVQGLPDNFVGSAVVIADRPLAIASARTSNAGRGLSGSYTGILASDATPNLVAPALFKASDLQTSELCLQDTSGVGQTAVVTYTDSLTASVALPANGSRCVDQGQEAHAAGWSGGARIASLSGQPIAAIVNITSWYGITPIGRWSYAAPSQYSIGRALALPVLSVMPEQGQPPDWTSRVYLFNPNDAPADVTLRYLPAGAPGLPCGLSLTIPPRGTGSFVPATPARPSSWSELVHTLAGYITSSQPLAGAIGFTSTRPLDATDRHFGYGAGYPYPATPLPTPCTPVPAPGSASGAQASPTMPTTGSPNDRQFVYQPYYFDIGATAMWGRGLTGAAARNPITVAVIDTGVDLSHPDLQGNLVPGHDFVNNTGQPQDESWDSHGTMVAGVIAARINNGLGVAGIGGGDALAGTPGIRIMPLRIARNLDPPPAREDIPCQRVADAIDYAVAHGARVINMSFETSVQCPAELASIRKAYQQGVALVAGAGNDGASTPVYPAAYEDDGANPHNRNLVIAVAGVYLTGVKALTSNYGPWLDVSAPFRRIRSTAKGGSYASDDGTSYSAAFVSGLLAMLMSNYAWTRDQAIAAVLGAARSTDAVNPNYRGLLGAGRINARLASEMTNVGYLPLARR